MTKPAPGRFFLVGAPRSGTTLLQSMLATHPTIASFPESHFLLISSRSRRGRWMRKVGLVSPEMRQRLWCFLDEIGHPELMPPVFYQLRPFIQHFAQILDQLAVMQGKSIWIEKTPGHLYYINDFADAIPDVRFIHLIRNGADVVASLYEVTNQHPEQWGHAYTIEQCVELWNRAVRLSMGYVDNTNHHIVCYEELVAEPERTLIALCDFIGVPFEAAMLDRHHVTAPQLIATHESWKNVALAPLHTRKQSKFTALFTEDQQRRILAQLDSIEAEQKSEKE